MRKALVVLAALFVITTAAPGMAAPPDRAHLVYDGIIYSVVIEKQLVRYAYELWVAQWCFDAANVAVSANFIPVDWAGVFEPTQGTAIVGVTAGVRCEAYVWRFPDNYTPVSGVVGF